MRNSIEDDLRETLKLNLDDIGQPALDRERTVRRTSRRRRTIFAGRAVALLGVAVAGFLVVTAIVPPPVSEQPSAQPAIRDSGETSGLEEHIDPVTPEYLVASGTDNGREWSLEVFIAEVKERPTEQAVGQRAFCYRWTFESEDTTPCYPELLKGLASGQRLLLNKTSSPFIGIVSTAVAELDIRVGARAAVHASTYDLPSELNLPQFRIFVAFAPGDGKVNVEAKDRSGAVLARTRHVPLPVLSVSKVGSGQGMILGFSGPDTDRRWIDCGSVCSVEVDGGTITLTAEPAEGSVFEGWDGACDGTGPCEITMGSSDVHVIARFGAP